MGKLTGTQHGDAATALSAFYVEKANELEDAGQWHMAAVALALGVQRGGSPFTGMRLWRAEKRRQRSRAGSPYRGGSSHIRSSMKRA
jgi:hypothetical protein